MTAEATIKPYPYLYLKAIKAVHSIEVLINKYVQYYNSAYQHVNFKINYVNFLVEERLDHLPFSKFHIPTYYTI